MKNQVLSALLILAFGSWAGIHCTRAALREARSGIAKGRSGDVPRSTDPIGFWTIVILTACAGAMGILFVLAGIAALLTA